LSELTAPGSLMAHKTKQKRVIKKDLECLECGRVRQIVRFQAKNREAGHQKKMFCHFCKRPTVHEEL